MVDGDAFEFCQRDAVELVGNDKSAFAYVFQLEVGLYIFFFEVVFLFTQFLGVVPPVPCFQLFSFAFFVHQLLQFGCFGFCLGECIVPQVVEEFHHGGGVLCHCIVQYKVGVAVKTQQLCLFKSQAYDVGNDFLVIVLVIVVATVDVGFVHLLA